jgi:hypothetical protein
LCRAFQLAGIKISLSQGFNPMPRLEISEPLSLGYESMDEYGIARINLKESISFSKEYLQQINAFLHSDLQIKSINMINSFDGVKVPSLSSSHWGSLFNLCFQYSDLDIAIFDKSFRNLSSSNSIIAEAKIISSINFDIKILLPFTGTKKFGLSSIFEKIYGVTIRESKVSVTRLNQYAKKIDGTFTSYYDMYLDKSSNR